MSESSAWGRECTGSLERGNCGRIVVSHDLVKRADPELCLRLTADVTDAAIQLDVPLEQCELLGWGDVDTGLRRAHRCAEEPSVQDAAASHSQIGLNPTQKPRSLPKGIVIAAEHGTLIQQPCLLDAVIHSYSHQPIIVSPANLQRRSLRVGAAAQECGSEDRFGEHSQ
jgi:hypothetical protein